MNRRIKCVVLFLLYLSPLCLTAQSDTTVSEPEQKPKRPFTDRINIGGNIGLTFGNVTYVEVAPVVTYQITNNWTGGVGGRYIYYKYNDPYNIYDFETSIYGGTLLSRYNIFRGLFAEADFEMNNTYDIYSFDPSDGSFERVWVPSLLLGGGFAQSAGGRSAIFISILYDVIQDPNSPYLGIPVIRGGVSIGL